jgi:hypothetical protein
VRCKAQCLKCDTACVVIIACERLKLIDKMTTWRDKVIVIVWITPNRVFLSTCISYAVILIWTSIL